MAPLVVAEIGPMSVVVTWERNTFREAEEKSKKGEEEGEEGEEYVPRAFVSCRLS